MWWDEAGAAGSLVGDIDSCQPDGGGTDRFKMAILFEIPDDQSTSGPPDGDSGIIGWYAEDSATGDCPDF